MKVFSLGERCGRTTALGVSSPTRRTIGAPMLTIGYQILRPPPRRVVPGHRIVDRRKSRRPSLAQAECGHGVLLQLPPVDANKSSCRRGVAQRLIDYDAASQGIEHPVEVTSVPPPCGYRPDMKEPAP
jgi:hypothetical protein